MKKPPILSDKPPSECFEQAFSDSCSGCVRDCACGRTVFDNANQWDWEDGELEHLERMAKSKPERYTAVDYSVATMTIHGEEWVMGCPCNGVRKWQEFLDQHADQAAKYLNERVKQLRAKAEAITVEAA